MAKRGQGEGTISKLPNGTYCGRLTTGRTPEGKQKRKAFYGKTRREVQEKMNAAKAELDKGIYIEPSNMTVAQWMDIWLKEYKKPVLRPTSYRNYSELFRLHICPYIGDIMLKNLRNDMIQRAINDLIKKEVPTSTIRQAYKTFYGVLEQAVNNELIVKNVVNGVTFPPTIKKPSRALTLEEQENVVELAKKYTGGGAFLMSLATGMRIGEVLALTWDDIDWKQQVVSVSKTLSYVKDPDDSEGKWHNIIGPTKTISSNRKIPLFPTVIELLEKIKVSQDSDKRKIVTALNNMRVAKGYSQKSIAEKVGISLGIYSTYEEGVRRPDLPTVQKIARLLKCDISELLTESENNYGAVKCQGKLRYNLRMEERKYSSTFKNEGNIVTVLRNKRVLKGYEQKEVAEKAGIMQVRYRNYECGFTKPDVYSIEKIADILECNVNELILPVDNNYFVGEHNGELRYKLKMEPINYYCDNNLVFCTSTGQTYKAGDMRRRFRELTTEANISDVHIHCLRHTFATRGLEQGIPLKIIQEILGHSTLQMTADIYTHVLPETKYNEVMKLEYAINI